MIRLFSYSGQQVAKFSPAETITKKRIVRFCNIMCLCLLSKSAEDDPSYIADHTTAEQNAQGKKIV